ncbi:SRPBCC family protein [Telluria sp. B2]
MASDVVGAQQGKSSRHGRSSTDAPGGGTVQDLGWIPLALGAAAILAGLGGRRKGAAALAVTAVAGAVGAMRSAQTEREKAGGEPEVERSITIGKTADELRHYWLDPKTLPQVMAGFATVRASGEGRMHWKVEGPLGNAWEWETETVDRETVDRPGEDIGWRSLPDAAIPNEGWVRFQPAPAGRGTVATLRFRFDPPAGALGEGLLKLLGTTPLDMVADTALRRFKNLVETGEIPTTERQPAARADTH